MTDVAEVAPRAQPLWFERWFESWFEPAVWGVIIANAGVTVWSFTDDTHEPLIEHLHLALGWLFTAEILVRFAQVRWNVRAFTRNPWNIFDLLLVVVCQLPVVGGDALGVRLIRLVRILRVVHSVRHVSTLRLTRLINLRS